MFLASCSVHKFGCPINRHQTPDKQLFYTPDPPSWPWYGEGASTRQKGVELWGGEVFETQEIHLKRESAWARACMLQHTLHA